MPNQGDFILSWKPSTTGAQGRENFSVGVSLDYFTLGTCGQFTETCGISVLRPEIRLVSESGPHLVTALSSLGLNFLSENEWAGFPRGGKDDLLGPRSGCTSNSLCSQAHPGDDGDHLLPVHVAEQYGLHCHDAAHCQRHPEKSLQPEGGSEGPQLAE